MSNMLIFTRINFTNDHKLDVVLQLIYPGSHGSEAWPLQTSYSGQRSQLRNSTYTCAHVNTQSCELICANYVGFNRPSTKHEMLTSVHTKLVEIEYSIVFNIE